MNQYLQKYPGSVAGVTFKNIDGSDRQQYIFRYCRKKQELVFKPEPDNQYDKQAVAIYAKTTVGELQIGYVSQPQNQNIHDAITNEGKIIKGQITKLTGGGKTPYGIGFEYMFLTEEEAKELDWKKVKAETSKGPSEIIADAWKTRNGKILLSITGVFVLCIACSLASTFRADKTETPTQTVNVQGTAEAMAWLSVTQTQAAIPTATELPTSTPTVVPTVDPYIYELSKRFMDFNDNYLHFLDQQHLLEQDISLMFDENWKIKTGLALGFLDASATDLENIPNPPDQYLVIDVHLKNLASETHMMVSNYATGIDTFDSTLIESAIKNIQNMGLSAIAITEELNRINSTP